MHLKSGYPIEIFSITVCACFHIPHFFRNAKETYAKEFCE